MSAGRLDQGRCGPPLFAWPVFSEAGATAIGDGVCVVVDQLRASSSMTTALANGAAAVHVCGEVEEALAKAKELRQRGLHVKLGGERGGLPIDGFDFGNLPREYGREQVEGVHIAFTTTNGTRAIHHAIACGAGEVLIGCLFNRLAVARLAMKLAGDTAHGAAGGVRAIHLLCAGTRGTVTLDDCLAAGAIAQACVELGADVYGGATLPYGDDTAVLYAELWALAVRAGDGAGEVEAILHRSRGGRNLARIGMKGEIAAVAAVDTLQTVPRLRGGVLVADGGGAESAQ